MSGRADREVFADALDEAEQYGLERRQLVRGRVVRRRGVSNQRVEDVQHACSGGARATVTSPLAAANATAGASVTVTRRVTPVPGSPPDSPESSSASTREPAATTVARPRAPAATGDAGSNDASTSTIAPSGGRNPSLT